jgi:hypothetical protein
MPSKLGKFKPIKAKKSFHEKILNMKEVEKQCRPGVNPFKEV